MGFLHLADIGGDKWARSTNVGMQDQVATLEWVRDNIENFGGDPDRVTIFGQSGGGSKVTTLMAMPSAQGLFHRAIAQSGSAMRGTPAADASEATERFLAKLGIASNQLDRLQELLGLYRRLHPAKRNRVLWLTAESDNARRWNAQVLGKLKYEQGVSPSYLYFFDWYSPVHDNRMGAYHTRGVDAVLPGGQQEGQQHVHRRRLAGAIHAPQQQSTAAELEHLVLVPVDVDDARAVQPPALRNVFDDRAVN